MRDARRLAGVAYRHALILTIVLASCAPQPGGNDEPTASSVAPTVAVSPPDARSQPVEGAWVLVRGMVDGSALDPVPQQRVTLIIEGTELGGVAACNQYGARVAMGPDGLRLEGLGMTAMGCRADVMALERAYLEGLMRVRRLERDGAELVASGDGVELRFSELESAPTADLVDVRWQLEALMTDDVVSAPAGDPAWLELRSDGTFAGSSGCRSFRGEWRERGDQILTPIWGMDETECPLPLQQQDGHVVQVIGDGFIPSVDRDLLTLMDVDGTGLTYRAAR